MPRMDGLISKINAFASNARCDGFFLTGKGSEVTLRALELGR